MDRLEVNGASIPALGLGTWTLSGLQCTRLVAGAIEAGYRHIDTAAAYENEREVGEAVRNSGFARDEIHVTTKVWHPSLAETDFQRAAEGSLKRLKLDYVDLLLIHWPRKGVSLAETVVALNEVRNRGLARHIGVSNFTTAQLAEAVSVSDNPIVCNQVEYHPYLGQDKMLAACRRYGMALISYCPLGRAGALFAEPAIRQAADAHGKTPAQIVLRWHVQQQGVGAIPRSSDPGRIRENLAIFDFELSPDEMAAIASLSVKRYRICDYEFSPEWDPA